ncbi:MAG: VOC family protein [Chloroflexi bacterium]|nr:VOC family protein [Chloroflexota bacterium]
MTKHVITHVELATTDTSATAAFYRALFGWDVQTYQPMDYVMANLGEGQTSIGFPIVNEYMKAGDTIVYVHTDDIDDSLAKAAELNAMVMMGKEFIPTVGHIAIVADPGGNKIAFMQPEMVVA